MGLTGGDTVLTGSNLELLTGRACSPWLLLQGAKPSQGPTFA